MVSAISGYILMLYTIAGHLIGTRNIMYIGITIQTSLLHYGAMKPHSNQIYSSYITPTRAVSNL